jgi:hypothetical protein
MAKAKSVSSWGDIDPKVFKAFEKKVFALREQMIPRDCDGDSPIEIIIVDKRTHSISARPVPRNEVYSYDKRGFLKFRPDKQRELDNETERWMGYNVSVATKEIEHYFDMRNHEFWRDKEAREKAAVEAKKPLKQRINEACEYCAKGTPFQLVRRDGRTDVPPYMHDLGEPSNSNGGGYCKAYKFHKMVAGIPDKPVPEEEWCKTCLAEMGERLVKRGVKGVSKNQYETVCINPQCSKSKKVKAAK